MPKIKPQYGGKPMAEKTNINGSVLDRIAPLREDKIGRLKVSLYGMPKTGKTRLACTFPKPLLIVGFEDGTASVVGTKGVDFVSMRATDEITDLLEAAGQGRWKTVVVDNATKMRELRIVELFKARGMEVPERKPFLYADKAWKEVWNQCSKDIKDLLGPLFHLSNTRELNAVVIAQEQTFGTEEEGGGSSDVIKPAISSALGKGLAMWLNAECDYVCNTFIREQTADKPMKIAGKDTINKVRTGKMEYCLRIGPHDTYVTGFRMPLGRPDPPAVLVNPSYESIVKLIRG